jgi:lipopolysaccharide export system permease protein
LNRIGRYIFRETFSSTVIVMFVLLLIFMSSQFAETLGEAAADVLPRDAVFQVFGLQFLQTIALIAPIGLLLGILLALARLNRDSEMAALAACGIGPARLLRPIGLLSVLVAGGVGWLALQEGPAANRKIEEISFNAKDQMELDVLRPDTFSTLDAGDTVFYAREAEDGLLRGVFVQRTRADQVEIVVAAEGEGTHDADTGELRGLELRNGRRYVGVAGDPRWWIESFAMGRFPITVEDRVFEPSIESRSTSSLLQSSDLLDRAELQWRIAVPLSVLILAVLAVPLGRASPREGKYARVGLGLLIYIIYANSLSIARVWMERSLVPEWLGMWWVHAALALLGLLMLSRQSLGAARRGEP